MPGYAEDIFRTGRELVDAVRGRPTGRLLPFRVGKEVARRYGVRPLGELEEVRERFFAISTERRIKHPAVAHIVECAKRDLLAGERA